MHGYHDDESHNHNQESNKSTTSSDNDISFSGLTKKPKNSNQNSSIIHDKYPFNYESKLEYLRILKRENQEVMNISKNVKLPIKNENNRIHLYQSCKPDLSKLNESNVEKSVYKIMLFHYISKVKVTNDTYLKKIDYGSKGLNWNGLCKGKSQSPVEIQYMPEY